MKEGDIIYLKPIGNAARWSEQIQEATITKVAKKYFYVQPSFYGRFYIDSMAQDNGEYISNYEAYLSMQDIADEKELNENLRWIEKYYHAASLSDSRKIIEILKKNLTPCQPK